MNHPDQASRQVLRRAALRARRLQRSLQRTMARRASPAGLSTMALVVGWLMAGTAAQADPTGGVVVGGTASITSTAPGTTDIVQASNRAIINWQSFGIGASETVNFVQPSSNSVTLNRVLGNDPSQIFGRMNANGMVMLVNPNGIVFGKTARVDVGGLVATTANVRDHDFMVGRYDFSQASPNLNAAVVNEGHLSIRDSGLAALVAPRVRNSGLIEARLGRVALGAAQHFTLDFHGDGLLSFGAGAEVSNALVDNSGTIRAEGGNVLLTARAIKGVVDNVINTSGIVAATSVSGSGGSIVLSGGGAGSVAVSGTLDASSAAAQGGVVMATGEHLLLAGTARVDASGRTGGGEIALGSTGLTDAAQRFGSKSTSVVVNAGAQLRADALDAGRGGNITLWSTDRTVFGGSLSARGGSQGGDGGFAEVSSLKDIGLTGQVDLRAARGKSGLLLIDPTDLRITDTASGGSQDGNATDASVAAGDANAGSGAALNTVSRGLLESLSGSANILLQATGQITVDAMAGGLVNLATTSGHSFTLQSTQSGGIRFVDAQTEIRTQGGAITLEALGIGSTLANIGKLTTNGGAVTLRATGDIALAGNVNAGAGAVSAQSTVGSISNVTGATPLLSGGAVTLTAGAGAIGAAGSAVTTHTTQLGLEAGGSIHAASDTALASLALTALDVAPGTRSYQVAAPGLSFNVADGSSLAVTQISQAGGLNLRVTSDRSLDIGTLDVGTGTLALTSTGGNLVGTAGSSLTASALTLAAQGSNGNNGAIGTAGQALNTRTASLAATAGSGGVYVANTDALALTRLSTTGSSGVTAAGTLTVGNVDAGSATLALGSTGGSVLDDGDAATRITASTLQLTAGGAVGASGNRLATTAGTISANAAVGGVFVNTSATSSVLSSIVSGNGAIAIGTGGSTTLTNLTSSTSSVANSITVAASGNGSFSVGTVNAGSAGNVNLSTFSGSIFGNSGNITGDTVTLNAATSGSVSVRTAASHLDVQAGSSSISITQTGSVTLDRLSTPSTLVSVTSNSGDITVGNVSTSAFGQVSLTAAAGAIRDDGNSATRISTGTAQLSASGAIGAPGQAVQTKATGLTASSTGDLVVTNSDATLTSLSLTNRHSAPGNAGTLQVTSPYLIFDVTDTGTSYTLDRLVGVPLNSLSFNGDTSLVVGQVQSAGSVSLTSTQGNLVDDGNLNTRVTAGSTLTLSAAQGGVGSLANPISVNTASLVLTTRGDLFVSNVTDLSSLTITSTHADATTSHGMGITAPSLKLNVTDSPAGHNIATLTDTSSLTLNFTSDRDITLGQVDVTNTGTARFTAATGVIKDDGDKNTRVLANSTTFSARAVGATGAGYLDVVTGTLAASASAGGVYVQLPMPTGSTNTTSNVTLGTITAAGPVAITALEGDLSLGGFLTATNQAVSLTATQGAILSPIGYSIGIGTGSLTLNAAKAIGASGAALPVTNSAGATLTAQAGTSMFVSASGAMTLASLDATAGISYTQSSGAITVGHVDASAGGTVSLTASSGAILDDGNGATNIRANQVTLSTPQGSVGATGTAIAVDAPKLAVTANGSVNVADSATLDNLSLTRGSGSSGSIAISGGAGQTFTVTEDGSEHYLQQVDSATPLAFSFSGQRNVKVGHIGVGSAGSASISSTASLVNDGVNGSAIAAGTVSLTAGSAGSIGATGAGNGLSLQGTTALTLSAGRNLFVASDVALADLLITSTNATTAAGTASVFGISGLGQTLAISDSGTTQSLDFSGTALGNARFTTAKNLQVGAINATGDVTLTTSGGGANSNITSDAGSGRITANRVLLTATSTTAGGGSIGSSSRALRVDTPTVVLNGSANVYVADAQSLTSLDMTLTHGTNNTFGYDVTASNLTLGISDGSTQGLSLATSGSMNFAYSVDRALSLGTIDAGTSSTGTISLTSRSAPIGTSPRINRGSGALTAGRISLSAVGTNGGVGVGGTLSTNTENLSVASGGNVSISNSTTLASLSLDAQHRTSGSSTHTYAISSTGLTFSISDSTGSNAFQLSNITQSGLDLSVKADRTITATRVNTGASGKATLQSSSAIQGGSGANGGSPSITTGELTLKGGSAYGYQGGTPLYTAASTLNSTLTSTLYLSNAGSLTLGTNTVGSSADVASSNNSLLQGSGGLFTAPTLKLSANQSLGVAGTLLTDARRLTLVSRGDVDVSNASDLYALSLTSTHGTPGAQNTLAVTAPRLTLALSDNVSGSEYHLSNLADSSGLDFTLSTDVALKLGTVNAQAGRALALYSTGTGTSITNDGASLLTAGSITLSATGSVGAAGSSAARMQTRALGLALITGANAYADNALDLSNLSLTSTQTAGGSAPVYQVTAPSLSFDITDDGTTHINNVASSTGLNFTLSTRRDHAVGSIDVGRSGTVSLASAGDILGDADSSKRISAASVALTASAGGAIGSVSNPIHLSVPLASFSPTGALNIESDTHIDRLGITTTHPTATYGGTYSIVSVPFTGPAYALFTATDSVTGTALTSLVDPLGLAFSFTSDRAMQVGTLNLGQTGTVSLTGTGSGGILGDGNASTLVQAASLSMASLGGAIGATGSGNGIDATVNSVSASALGGSVNLALHGRTTLGSISGTGGINLANDEGDIALGAINAGGSAVNINNQGGSILSGSIVNTTTVSLTASGSIGNDSAINTSANGGGTTTLTASASAAHGAAGSIAVTESYNLTAASVTAPAAISLASNLALYVGTVTSGAAVALESFQGSINGSSGSNAVTGTRVDLSARYGTGNAIGDSGVRLNVNTPQLVLNTPGSVYVTNSADLNLLTIDRTNYLSSGSGGTLSVIASGLTFSATDSGNTTTLTSLSDATGLDFSYLGVGSLSVGSLNVGSGSLRLQAWLDSGDGNINAINNSSLITAGALTLQAYGSGSNIGSSGTALGLAVGSLTASSGTGGLALRQAGSLTLSNLSTTGDLAVTASSGDLTLGTLSYGSARTLNLTASNGSLLAGGGTLAGGGANAAITLSAANGIGTDLAPVLVNASAGHTVNASVTGTGSLNLKSLGTLGGGLTTSVHDGATTVTAAGNTKLTAMSTGTDRAGNDIKVTASAGDLTVVSVSGGSGASFNAVNLAANAGRLLAAPGATLEAFDVKLHGATGVGSSTDRVAANGQRVRVSSGGGAIYLTAATPAVLTAVESAGGAINITHSADLLLANAASSGGAITVTSTTAGADLIAGNLDAGSGALTISTTGAGARIMDDGDRNTRLAGGTVSLTGAGGVGSASLSVQTSAATLSASSGNGIYLDDNRSAGVTLASVVATGGAVSVASAGPTVATLVQAVADSAGNNVALSTSSGDLTLVSVSAGATQGSVSLSAAGSILASGSGTHVSGHSATLAAGADIGAVTDLATGAGTPVKLNVGAIAALSSSGSNRVVSVLNTGSTALSLGGGALSLGSGSSAYIATAGDLDVSAGIALANGNLSLTAGGTLLLPTTAISTTGAVRLTGGTDILTSGSGAAARNLQVSGSSLVLASGAAGGDTRLTTAVGSLDATLSGAGKLTVENTGTLTGATLATSNGDIAATSSTGFTAGSVVAGGTGRTVTLTATNGDLSVGTVNAGSAGTINLSAANGSLLAASPAFTAAALNLTSGTGIGSATTAFDATGMTVTAQVTGTGAIHLGSNGALTLGALSTADGDIHVTAAGQLAANGALSAGQSGNVALTSTGGNVTLAQAFSNLGADSSRSGLTVQGQQILLNGGSVATSGTQTYNGAVILGAGTTLTASGVNFAGTVDGAQALTVNAGTATFGGAVGATTRVGALAVNSAGATTFNGSVRAASLATDAAGSLAVNGGTVDTTGTQTYGERAVLGTGTTLTGSTVTLAAGAEGAQQLAIAGNTVLGGNVTTQGTQAYGGSLTLTGNSTLNASGITFGGSVDGARDLTVNAGTGNVAFTNAVGGTTRLAHLVINTSGETRLAAPIRAASVTTDAAGTLVLANAVNTTGAQTYGERAMLAADVTLTGSTLTLSQGADGAQALTLAGNALLGGALGAQQALNSLTVSGSSALNGGAVTTTGAQTYGGAVTLGTGTTLAASGVNFGSSVDGAQALTVNAGTATFGGAVGGTTRVGALAVNSAGATIFNGSVRAASLATDAAGSLAINGGTVDTTGTQTYGEHAVLGTGTTLTGSTVTLAAGADGEQQLVVAGNTVLGGNVTTQGTQAYNGAVTLIGNSTLTATGFTFGGSVDGARDLTVNAGAGNVAFTNAVGGSTRLASLVINTSGETRLAAPIRAASLTTDAAGTLVLAGTVDTTGAQTYGERAVLAADVTLTGSTLTLSQGADGAQALTLAGNAQFGGAVGAQQALNSLSVSGDSALNGGAVTTSGAQAYGGAVTLGTGTTLAARGVNFAGTVDGAQALAVNAGAAGATFNGAVGATARLGGLTVTTPGATRFGAAVRAASLATDAAGILQINGGTVDTTGSQTYGERAVLGAGTTLTGSTVTLAAGADGTQQLAIVGNTVLGGDVTTQGAQAYGGSLTLTGNSTLSGSGVNFGGSVDGARDLTINAGTGNVAFTNAVGGSTRLVKLVINSSGETRLAAPIRAASLTTDAAGTLVLASTVDTIGAQSYGERAVLAADVTLTGSMLTLSQGADGAQALTLAGNAQLGGAIGAQQALNSLTVSGNTALNGGAVTTTGTQAYGGAVTLGADTTLAASGISFGGTVDGAQALTVRSGAGGQRFDHAVGGQTRLGALVINSNGETRLAAPIRAASLTTDAAGTLVLASTVDTTGAQTYGERAVLAADVALTGSSVTLAAGADATTAGGQSATITGNTVIGGAVGAVQALNLLRVNGPLTAPGAQGLQLTGHSFAFSDAVTATLGGITLTNTSASGTVSFAANGPVQAATGFQQTGGASVLLPSQMTVTAGPISIAAPASLPTGIASISTQGDITLRGLSGPSTALTLTAGSGAIRAGLADADPANKVNLGSLAVVSAASAQMYGGLGDSTGALVASRVNSPLAGAPYFFNDTPWGPIEAIARVTSSTVPRSVVPSTPGVTPLFTGVVDRGGVAPNVLGVYASPQVLTVEPMFAPLSLMPGQPQAPSGQERGATEPPRPVCGPATQNGSTTRSTTEQCR